MRCIMVLALTVDATKIGDMANGAKFDKCISITDWETKSLADDITLKDRLSTGCCPSGYVPGAKLYAAYQGAQVVCGVGNDGAIQSSMGAATACTFGSCYVHKQNLKCSDDSSQRLNGCCAAQKTGGGTCTETISGKGVAYRGCQAVTRGGKTCQAWSAQTPQEHTMDTAENGLLDGTNDNYCRNPDESTTIWCYTTNGARFEFCDPVASTDLCKQDDCGFKSKCKNYAYTYASTSNAAESVSYCLTWHKTYSMDVGSAVATDDVSGGKFKPGNFNTYTTCEGGSGGSGTGAGGTTVSGGGTVNGSNNSDGAVKVIGTSIFALMMVIGVFV